MTKALDRILVSAGIIVAVCAVARAEPVASPVAPATAAPYPRNRLALVLGIGSPFGEVGLSYQRQLAPSFAIEGGVGAGLTGTQFPLLAKTMTGGGQMHVYLEVGPSLSLRESKTALWAVAEVGLELSLGNWIVAFGAKKRRRTCRQMGARTTVLLPHTVNAPRLITPQIGPSFRRGGAL